MNMNRELMKKIIELTSHEYNGEVWGDDTVIGTMDELIDEGLKIINNGFINKELVNKNPNDIGIDIYNDIKFESINDSGVFEINFWLYNELIDILNWRKLKNKSVKYRFIDTLNDLNLNYDFNREYHNLNHIKNMIDTLNDLTKDNNSPWFKYCSVKEFKLLKIAILFHDIIYIPGGDYNEEMSACYAKNVMSYLKYDKDDINMVIDLIYHTKVYLHKPSNIIEHDVMNLIHDLDFHNFSLPYDEFLNNNLNIVKEQRILNRDLKWFQENWFKYLLNEIDNGWRLYCTKYTQENWEPKAIDNIKRILREKNFK